MSTETPPMIDLPVGDIPEENPDTRTLAEEMSDVEAKALLIETFRLAQEMIGAVREIQEFVHFAAAAMQQMAENPMAKAMMPGMVMPNGQPMNRQQRRANARQH